MKSANIHIFGFSALASVAVLLAVLFGAGWAALGTTIILAVIEITFSFDNAVVNAKILEKLSPAWQTAFLTVGVILAVFVVRLVLPIVIVMASAGLGFSEVLRLAFDRPELYADKLTLAHPLIASFGGAFLLSLALEFFLNDEHKTLWWKPLESKLKRLANFWAPPIITLVIVVVMALAASDWRVLAAGVVGVASWLALRMVTLALGERGASRQVLFGWAGLSLFIYLQFLDASFSLDGVVGAFAISDKILLIAAGLGIGALWIRSLTIFMVRRKTLASYKFLEHGAYYTIALLSAALFASLFVAIPDYATGLASVAIIASAITSSVRARRLAV